MSGRRHLSRLLLVANILGANLMALVIVVVFVYPPLLGVRWSAGMGPREIVFDLTTGEAWLLFVLCLGLLVANLWWFLRRSPAEEPLRHVESEAPGGIVRVAKDAIENGLRGVGEGIPGVSRVRVVVTPMLRRVRIAAWYQCPEGVSNLEASRRLREALDQRFRAMVQLPEGAQAEYEIEFVGFFGRLSPKDGEDPVLAGEPEPEPSPFTGPQYPIDDDEETNL